jgi:transcriptional regulator NrdR family protein
MDAIVKYCPNCGEETSVISTRENTDGTIRRRRECPVCGQRFTTREVFVGFDTRKKKG